MSNFSSRPALYPQDQEQVIDLLLDYRAASSVTIYSTAWRLRLLWSSRVWDSEADACIWQDAAGRVCGFAMLWRRRLDSPYLTLKRLVRPASVTGEIMEAMLAWGVGRAQAIARQQGRSLTLYTNQLSAKVHPDDALERHGFAISPVDPQHHNVYFARTLADDLPAPALPAGYTMRQLREAAELEAYAALYGFTPVNPQHRQELLDSDEYCHLVLADPDGRFAAYCEFSICREEWQRSGQRLGWIDYIETAEERRGQGLGRALLLASLERLRGWGAEQAWLVTVSDNRPAIGLYQAGGFLPVEAVEAPGYEKVVNA